MRALRRPRRPVSVRATEYKTASGMPSMRAAYVISRSQGEGVSANATRLHHEV